MDPLRLRQYCSKANSNEGAVWKGSNKTLGAGGGTQGVIPRKNELVVVRFSGESAA